MKSKVQVCISILLGGFGGSEKSRLVDMGHAGRDILGREVIQNISHNLLHVRGIRTDKVLQDA